MGEGGTEVETEPKLPENQWSGHVSTQSQAFLHPNVKSQIVPNELF